MIGKRASWRGWRAPLGRRLQVAVVVVACAAGQVGALAHRALVQHAVCAEHGESVHLRGQVFAAGVSLVRLPPPAARPVWSADSAALFADGHEHCSLAASRSTPVHHAQAEASILDGAGPAIAHPRTTTPGSIVARYLVAPKTSPPSAAPLI